MNENVAGGRCAVQRYGSLTRLIARRLRVAFTNRRVENGAQARGNGAVSGDNY